MSDGATQRKLRAAALGVVALLAALVYALGRHPTPPPPSVLRDVEPSPVAAEPAGNEAPPPLESAASPAVAASAPSELPAPSPELDEGELMRRLRLARGSDAAAAVELARAGNRRFPASSDAAERASILIHSLAELGLASQARGEAEDMVNRYSDSAWVREIENFTGAHRHRNVRVDEEGRLSFVDPPPPPH